MPSRGFRLLLVAGLGAVGCGVESHRLNFLTEAEASAAGQEDSSVSLVDAGVDGGTLDSGVADAALGDPLCPDEGRLPKSLACTGLFSDVVEKKLAPGVMEFTPASPLWSDGAEKYRWIQIPEGEQIDTSDPGSWKFPIGTKAWKEFRVDGHRVETRIIQKVRDYFWWRGTYQWNADETEATFTWGGEDIPLAGGGTYYLPDRGECDDCHEGQNDRLLGFEAVSLGMPGAAGMTLERLAEAGWLSDPPEQLELSLGDDGTGKTDAIMLLHINCGVSCHNDGPNATAGLTKLNFELEPGLLDGRPPDEEWPIVKTAMGIPARGAQWGRVTRIAPGAPEASLVVQLMGTRSDSEPQMPPIASRVVDEEGLALVRDWIQSLPSADVPAQDAGVPDAASELEDAAVADDAGLTDDASTDAGLDAPADGDAAADDTAP